MTPENDYWPAPAKLNLFLEVTGRRADGYHELQTVFQLLDWGDRLAFEVQPGGEIDRCTDLPGVPAEQDLSVRAARCLQDHCGVSRGARLWLEKSIPAGAGLGGASSDAATTLVVLNQLWGCHLGPDELAGLGLQLGADVPVFVKGCSAWGSGVGEQLQPVELGERHYVLLMPGFHVSTAELFRQPELDRNAIARLPFVPAHIPECESQLPNAFSPLVKARFPQLLEWFAQLGKDDIPRMTGTGSTWFFCVEGESQASRLTTRLKSLYNSADVEIKSVKGVDHSPLMQRLRTKF